MFNKKSQPKNLVVRTVPKVGKSVLVLGIFAAIFAAARELVGKSEA